MLFSLRRLELSHMRHRAWPIPSLLILALAGGADRLAAEPPPPVTVALTLDTSGSVGAVEFSRARDLALAILGALPPGSEVAVLAFDDQSRVIVPRTSKPQDVRQRLATLKVGGRFTALHDALYDAGRYLRDAPGERKAIVLITDGLDENSTLNLEDGLRVATDAQIPVYAVGVGTHPQERVLRRIAKLTGGDYLTFDRARGTDLAARIATMPVPAVEAARPAAVPPSAAERATGAASAPARPSPPASSARGGAPARLSVSGSGRVLWIAVALTVAGAVAIVLLTRRRKSAERAEAPTRVPSRAPSAARGEPGLSETVLARMSLTEEYLERTVTLQERPVLAVTRGPGVGQVFALSGTTATSIGRSRANDIRVEDVSVSGQHCRVRPEEGRFVVHDLRSTNGTLVNDKKVTRHVLAEGDVIQIGETALQYRHEMKRG
jgi:hypothetical protein